jgi:hypothetical protein
VTNYVFAVRVQCTVQCSVPIGKGPAVFEGLGAPAYRVWSKVRSATPTWASVSRPLGVARGTLVTTGRDMADGDWTVVGKEKDKNSLPRNGAGTAARAKGSPSPKEQYGEKCATFVGRQ